MRLRLDAKKLKLVGRKAEGIRRKHAVPTDLLANLRSNGKAVGLVARDNEKRNGVNWDESPWRENGALDSFLPAVLNEGAKVGKISKLFFEDSRFGANRERLTNLGDDDANLARGNLHPRIFLD
ncbi:MAG TPA: hypothetical protein VMU43_12240 [Candidatus Acidoferrum sp.]|nr:hypothetical protein [Candidatus Acidoferrum sp.]